MLDCPETPLPIGFFKQRGFLFVTVVAKAVQHMISYTFDANCIVILPPAALA